MPNIYVTYRSGDSSNDEAKLFIHILKKSFMNDSITLTDADRNADVLALHDRVREHDVLIVLIGKRFFNIVDEHAHPVLWDTYDYLHAEVFAALETPRVRVICVLTDGTKMPGDSFFPDNLKALRKKRIITIKHIRHVPEAVAHITDLLKKTYHPEQYKPPKELFSDIPSRNKVVYTLFGLLAVIVIALVGLAFNVAENNAITKRDNELATLSAVTTQNAIIRLTANAVVTTNATLLLSSHDPTLPENQVIDEHGVAMVRVPAGCFWMGSDNGELDEQPIHEICIEDDFWIDQYEVTNEQFASLDAYAEEEPDWSNPMQPRTSITWFEALDFCQLRGGSLPTEAQWEYAAKGVNSLIYPWGNEFVADYVVYAGNSDNEPSIAGGRLAGASWVGAYDMSGNVWEWVSSASQDYPYNASDGREDLDDLSMFRMSRGGAYNNFLNPLHSTHRLLNNPNYTYSSRGFRCAVSDPIRE